MHLCDGRSGHRDFIQFGEHLGPIPGKLSIQRLADVGPVKDLRSVLKRGQFSGECRRKDVCPVAEQLSEFDKGGAQFLKSQSHPLPAICADRTQLPFAAGEQRPNTWYSPMEVETANPIREAVSDEDTGEVLQAPCSPNAGAKPTGLSVKRARDCVAVGSLCVQPETF